MSVTIRNETTGTDLHYNTYEIVAHTGDTIDTLKVNLPPTDTVNALDNIVVKSGGVEIWGGFAKDKGTWKIDGTKEIEVLGYGSDILNNRITLDLENKSPEYILGQAVSGTDYVIETPVASGITIEHYTVNDTIRTVFAEMMARTGWVIRFTPEKDGSGNRKIYFESPGYLSSGYSYNSATDNIKINEWREEIIETVRNHVKVIGQGEMPGLTISDLQASTASGTAENPGNIIDGNTITYTNSRTSGDYVEINFGKKYSISSFRYYVHSYFADNKEFKVEYWDGSAWQPLLDLRTSSAGWSNWHNFTSQITSKIKITFMEANMVITEIELLGKSTLVKYEGEASDASSISTYGERFAKYTLDYIQSDDEAQSVANALLVPNPKSGGSITVAWDETIMVNETVALVDALRNINGNYVVLEQRIGNGMTTLQLGWTKTQGYLDAKREEIELRKARARTLGTSLDSDIIDVDISDTDTTNPESINTSDTTELGINDTNPESINTSDTTELGINDTNPESINTSDTTELGINDKTPDVINAGEKDYIVNDPASNTLYSSSWQELTEYINLTGSDPEDIITVRLYISNCDWSNISDPQVAPLHISLWASDNATGSGNVTAMFYQWVCLPNGGWEHRYISFPAQALYEVMGSVVDTIKAIQIKITTNAGLGSGTGQLEVKATIYFTDAHKHTTNEDPHTHTITGDNHKHTTNEDPHTHTITGDNHKH
ncbi:MAG: hypothetical protein DRN17_02105, partial [Thermoplasmata archaeon]